MRKYSVLVVDDSAFMRKMVSDILNQSERLEVVGTARNGEDAIKKIELIKPAVITLDVEMPVMDGIETLKIIMDRHPTPVVMLSSLTKTGADKTIEAITLGAVDFIAKPSGSISLNIKEIENEIISKVEQAVQSNITVHSAKKAAKVQISKEERQVSSRIVNSTFIKTNRALKPIVAIGSSTGGPRALQEVITSLPGDFQAPVVIVQHMPKGFTKSLADRLNKLSEIDVKEVEDGDVIEPGKVYIAQGGKQFEVEETGNKFLAKVRTDVPVNGHQPSVDVLFTSIAKLRECQPVAVILTGMGSDGSKGIETLKRSHPRTVTISQSEETCVVYGMPQAAVKTSLVDYVLDIQYISEMLQKKSKQQG
ncbi:two-component system, chemotaxis family, response regulator CheB [Gracilibacillus ureilyticus]|uniref:Protein-glutamate methylesterase/protein-glutamine glutaminase n=1 Tax=Gracilibacillus ureilyticus TaxID=531814 RepID=A0A1H9L6C2_9BACI|nr:chemotaxis response regulator protein-glutamate methylesterase [Gracilibacillus ureilyticus]SER06910.1 two-component system, chemotaxis family, response regulator CheB [Gracilibacillus ureilyticus]